MKMFSLRTIIDDILLLVRNNNISESEDLSRAHIASWVMQYRAQLSKEEADKEDDEDDDDTDDTVTKTLGPLELTECPIDGESDSDSDDTSCCCHYMHRKRLKEKISTLDNSAEDIVSVHDARGCVIQYMHQMRRHYHNFRRYTYSEVTCWFNDGYLYVEGNDLGDLQYVYVTCKVDPMDNADDEDDVDIPGWMVPKIKSLIIRNELSFMLGRPSDDSNNSTLASVKPNGYQDKEK